MITRILLSLSLLFAWAHAESIKSITGNIIFDINNDGTSEAHLNSDGLAIGDGLSPSANLHLQGNGIITGDLVIGGMAGNSTLEIQGTVGYNTQTISSNTTLSGNSVILVDTSSDNVTVTLPYAGNVMGRLYTIKKTSTSNEVLLKGGGNNIDSSPSYTFTSGNNSSIKVVSNGNQWYVLSKSDIGLSAGGCWTPADITTALWLDADDASTITADAGGNVSQWNDKSGNGWNVTQATSTRQPTTSSYSINSINTIAFDGDNLTGTGSGTTAGDWTLCLIIKQDTGGGDLEYLLDFQTDRTAWATSNNGGGATDGYSMNSTGTWEGVDNSVVTYVDQILVFETKTNGDIYRDGTSLSVPAWSHTAVSLNSTFSVGSKYTGTENYFEGKIGELIFIPSAVTASDRQKLEGYLAHKWGLEGNLDAGHPYKNSPP